MDEVKERNSGSFFIAYTGLGMKDLIISYLNKGCDRFVDKNKPNHQELLTQYIKEGLEVAISKIEFINYLKEHREKTNA